MNQQNSNGQNYQEPMNGQNYQNSQNYQNYQNSQNYQGSQNYQQVQQPAGAPVVPAAPVAPEKPKKSSKKIFIIIGAIILAIALGVGGFFVVKHFMNKTPAPANPVTGVPLDNPVQQISAELRSTIELYPDSEVDKKDLEDFSKVIDERLAVLGETYHVRVEDDKIVMVIEKALLGETAAERTSTIALVTSRGNINFGEHNTSSYSSYSYDSPTKDNISEITVQEYKRTDLLKDHRLDFEDTEYDKLDALNNDTVYGIKIKFSKEGATKFEEIVEDAYSSNPKFALLHDYLYKDYYIKDLKFMGTVLAGDDYSIVEVVTPGCSYKKNAELMKKVLEQGEEFEFGLVAEIADEPIWEVEGKYMGKNQKTEMSGEAIIAEFTPNNYSLSNVTEVEFAEYEDVIKKRLDALGIDYMFGISGFNDKTYCIKVKPQDFAPDFFRLIFNRKYITTQSAFDSVPCFSSPEIAEVGSSYVLRLDSSYSADQILSQYNVSGNIVYLIVNDVTIASADISQLQPDDDGYGYYLDFANFLCFGDVENIKDGKNVLDLIVAISEESSSPYIEGTFRFRSQGMDDNLELGEVNWKYEILTAEDKRVFQLLKDNGYSAQKKVEGRNMLEITLDLPLNDNLPTAFLEEVKTIYELCAFDSGAYNKIVFVIKDETKECPADKCRVTAEKDTYSGKMELNDEVSGPKFSDYWSDFYEIMKADQFYIDRSW